MKIKILVSLATQQRGYGPGDVVFWADKADAERLIKAGFAEAIVDQQPASLSKR